MTSIHYSTLFVEGDVATRIRFRAAFDPYEVGGERCTCFLDLIDDAATGGRRLMYSFCIAGDLRLELFDVWADLFPTARLILLHDAAGTPPACGFAVFELGRRVRYGGALPLSDDTLQPLIDGAPSDELYGRHRLTTEVYERRMRAVGVMPDDPDEGRRTGDNIDW